MPDFIFEGEIDPMVCDDLLEFYETCTYVNKITNQATPRANVMEDNVFRGHGKTSTDLHLHMVFTHNEWCLKKYFGALSEVLNSYFDEYEYSTSLECAFADGFNIQRYAPGEGYTVWHSERANDRKLKDRVFAWMTYLTDNPDGGTEWLYQNKYVAAKKGKTVIWPAEWTHTHRGRVDPKLEKTIITGWVDLI